MIAASNFPLGPAGRPGPGHVPGHGVGPGSGHSLGHASHPGPDLVAADAGVASRYFLAGAALGKLAGRTVLLPFTTVAELATWPERLLWGHARTEELCQWLDSRRMIVGDDTVARVWARITVAAQRAGSVPPPNDTWIAAGCLSYGLPLATLNARQYEYFALRYGLQLI